MALEERTPMAAYYLGNLWYDKKQYDDAVQNWEKTVREKPDFPTAHRNLALALFNKRGDAKAAVRELELAYSLDETDSRVLMELDQLYKKCGRGVKVRLAFLEEHMEQTSDRDDLYVEYITLLNLDGQYRRALDLTLARRSMPGKAEKERFRSSISSRWCSWPEKHCKKTIRRRQSSYWFGRPGPIHTIWERASCMGRRKTRYTIIWGLRKNGLERKKRRMHVLKKHPQESRSR